MKKKLYGLLLSLAVVGLCVGCESFQNYRDKQTKIARGEYKEPTGPVQHGTASQPLFRPRMLNQVDPDETGPVIRADIMLVNGQEVRPPDVLEPIWQRLERLAYTTKPDDYREQMHRLVYNRVRETINEFLVYSEVKKKLTSEAEEALKKAVDGQVRDRVNSDFEGSQAKFERYLSQRGMTMEDYKKLVGRQIAVHQYLREEIVPKIRISRRRLYEFYNESKERLETPAKVRLQMIDIPLDAFLPPGRDDAVARQQAHDKARTQADKAMAELKAGKNFAEVARKYSKGIHAEDGGRWDWIREDAGMAGRWRNPPRSRSV